MSFDEQYELEAMEKLRFASSRNDVIDYLRDLHEYTRSLEFEIDELLTDSGRKRNDIDKLLAKDKSAIIDALINTQTHVKIGRKKFSIQTAVEKYKMELEEVLVRVEDQRLVGSKGNVVQTKRCLCDFVLLLDRFTELYDSVSEKIVDLERKNRSLDLSVSREKRRADELEDTLERVNSDRRERTNEINTLTRRVAALLDEIDELKKPVKHTELNQKRTVQRK